MNGQMLRLKPSRFLTGRARRQWGHVFSHTRSRYHYSSSTGGSSVSHTPKPHLLLCGGLAFVWDKERITNNEVHSYLEQHRLTRFPTPSPSTSTTQTTLQSRLPSSLTPPQATEHAQNTPSAPAVSPSQATEHAQNSPSAPAPSPSLPPPQATEHAQNSSASSWSIVNWFYGPSSQSQQEMSVTHNASSTGSTPSESYWSVVYSYIPWSTSNTPKESPKPSSSDDQSQGFWSVAYSYLPWTTSYSSQTSQDGLEISTSQASTLNDHNKGFGIRGKDSPGIRGRDGSFLRHYHAQLASEPSGWLVEEEERENQLLDQSLGVLEGFTERTKDAVLGFFTSARASEEPFSRAILDECLEGDSQPDLACAGGSLGVWQEQNKPRQYTMDWTKCYMQLESAESAEEPEIDKLSKKMKVLVDQVKNLSALSQGYFKDQFLVEEYFLADQATESSFQKAVASAKDSLNGLLTEVLERFHEESLVLNRDTRSSRDLNFEPSVGVRTTNWVPASSAWKEDQRSKVKLEVISEELAKVVRVQRKAASVTSNSDSLSGWEYINGDGDYSAYRKLYKDTGLFQYKVIGRLADVTAKDFHEVQVDHEFRKSWDEYAGDMITVDTDYLTSSKLIHWIMKYPFPMSDREYLFVQRSWVSPDQDTIVIMNRSASHPGISGRRRCVRVTDYFSHMVIRAHSRIDRLGMDFELHYFDNPHSQLPSSCVNWVASSAMPDFMNKIHQAALTKHPPQAR